MAPPLTLLHRQTQTYFNLGNVHTTAASTLLPHLSPTHLTDPKLAPHTHLPLTAQSLPQHYSPITHILQSLTPSIPSKQHTPHSLHIPHSSHAHTNPTLTIHLPPLIPPTHPTPTPPTHPTIPMSAMSFSTRSKTTRSPRSPDHEGEW